MSHDAIRTVRSTRPPPPSEEATAGGRLLTATRLAWPTLLLLAGATALWTASVFVGMTGRAPPVVAMLAASVASFLAFTPFHEAAHRSVGRSAALNGAIGRVSGFFITAPFLAARHYHHEHHRHTNDPAQDPDHWSGRGPRWLLPLRWATQDLHYYWLFMRSYGAHKRGERIESVATAAGMLGLFALALGLGYGLEALLYWVLPARIAVLFLAFAFDYVPHRPHVITAAQDRYRATHVIDSALLNVVLLGQSYHLIHHLYPAVPFYRYRSVWKREQARLLGLGVSRSRTGESCAPAPGNPSS